MRGIIPFILLFLCGSIYARTAVHSTFVSGSLDYNRLGVYGIKGQADPNNMPGSRSHALTWRDGSGNLWLFGGRGYAQTGVPFVLGFLNDLWKFDGTNWTWFGGSDTVNQPGVYGTKGIAHPNNMPGARSGNVSWIDANGDFWLFGGNYGPYAWGTNYRNDLWRFDGTNWTWVSGSDQLGQTGVYGIKGVAAAANVPGARDGSAAWIDSSGNLWLFGGINSGAMFNDLWRFDGTNWTWVSGSNTTNQPGVYGTKGVPHPACVPGARVGAVSWIDADDNLWLFGGLNYNQSSGPKSHNDLWRFDGTNWTWMSGSNLTNHPGVLGVDGIPDPQAMPDGTYDAASWTDANGHFWLCNGSLWRYDGACWTWVRGYDENGASLPITRGGAVSWSDGNNLWFFGGWNPPIPGMRDEHYFNDLWKFEIYTRIYNLQDFEAFSQAWRTFSGQSGYNRAWDLGLPPDGMINLSDLRIFCEGWLQ